MNLIYPFYKLAVAGAGPGPIDLDADPIYCMLVTQAYVTLAAATLKGHQYRSAILAGGVYEAAGTGYTAGGVALAGKVISQVGDNSVFTASNPFWTSSSITARGAVLFKRVGADLSTPADDPLICLLDFGGDKSSSAATFTVTFNSSGILSFT